MGGIKSIHLLKALKESCAAISMSAPHFEFFLSNCVYFHCANSNCQFFSKTTHWNAFSLIVKKIDNKNVKHPNVALKLKRHVCACNVHHCNYINVVWSFQMGHTHTQISLNCQIKCYALFGIVSHSSVKCIFFSFYKWRQKKYTAKKMLCAHSSWCSTLLLLCSEIAIIFGPFKR